MRRLDRYVLKELSVPLCIGTVAVLLMFQANLLIALLKQVSMQSIPLDALFKIIWLKTPQFLTMTLPIGTSMGASLALSRLTRESELTALRTAGASIQRVMLPVVAVGALVGVFNFWVIERWVPTSERAANKLMTELAILGAVPEFKSNVIVNLKSSTASFGSVMRSSSEGVEFSDALLIERQRAGEVHVYRSSFGTYTKGVMTLKDARLWIFKGDQLTDVRPEKDLVIYEPISISDLFVPTAPPEKTAEELRTAIAELKGQRRDTVNLEVAYYTKYSVPFSCVAFALVGPVFAIWLGRSGGFIGVLLSFLIVLAYYNAFVISTEILGKNGWLTPTVAAWLPNALFLVLGVFLLRRLE